MTFEAITTWIDEDLLAGKPTASAVDMEYDPANISGFSPYRRIADICPRLPATFISEEGTGHSANAWIQSRFFGDIPGAAASVLGN